MQPKRSSNTTRPAAWIIWTKRLATIAVSVVLGFSILSLVDFNTPFVTEAYATIRSVDDEVTEEQLVADENEKSNEKSGSSESIEDEENPMSSGLGGGEPVSNDMGFGAVAIIGIVVVAAFFFILMRKLNTSIKHMNSMFK